VLADECLGHLEVGEGHVAYLVIEVADQGSLQGFFQRLRYGWQHDLPSVGPGVVALADDLDAERLGRRPGQSFKLAFEWVRTRGCVAFVRCA